VFTNDSKQQAANKLTILYAIKGTQHRVTNSEITDFIIQNDFLNYFELQQYISELIEASLLLEVTINDIIHYEITEKGYNSIKFFSERLDKNLRLKIDGKLENFKKAISNKSKPYSYIIKSDEVYKIKLTLHKDGSALLNCEVQTDTEEKANKIASNWKKNHKRIHSAILETLLK
jgi:predicted transcriptional regulator